MLKKTRVENEIVKEVVTRSLVEKTYAKIVNEEGGFTSKMIPRLLNTVLFDVVHEELWTQIKKHKNPIIDFAYFQRAVYKQTKFVFEEIF